MPMGIYSGHYGSWFKCAEAHKGMCASCIVLHVPAMPSPDYYHAIILDVDSKERSLGMSSPPMSFTDREVLKAACTLLHEDGVCVCACVCVCVCERTCVRACV